MNSALISTSELEQKVNDPHLRILDASWHMPAEKRDAQAEFKAAHIPGAQFFNIDEVCDKTSPYPHMLPSATKFATAAGVLGISNDDEIVVYDSAGLFSAARVWWMFRVYGHDKIKVLDGGLPEWKAGGRKLESGIKKIKPIIFTPHFRPALLRDRKRILANITSKHELVLDARSPARFSGQEPEPRPGLKSGHIEGSRNVYFRELLVPPHNTLMPQEDLRELLFSKSVDPHQPTVATCGSGVTACILALALYGLGNESVAIYDGAWAEWGSTDIR